MTPPDSGDREVQGRLCDVCLRGSIPCNVDPPAWLCDLKWPSSWAEHYRIGYERYRNGANGPVLSLDLAQRILAALETGMAGTIEEAQKQIALARELRAAVERKP